MLSNRVVSDIQTRDEGEMLYVRYNTAANIVEYTCDTNGLFDFFFHSRKLSPAKISYNKVSSTERPSRTNLMVVPQELKKNMNKFKMIKMVHLGRSYTGRLGIG